VNDHEWRDLRHASRNSVTKILDSRLLIFNQQDDRFGSSLSSQASQVLFDFGVDGQRGTEKN
jgi:hypothetical protein